MSFPYDYFFNQFFGGVANQSLFSVFQDVSFQLTLLDTFDHFYLGGLLLAPKFTLSLGVSS